MTHQEEVQHANQSVIVVGVDFSEASAGALKEATALAGRTAIAELHVVYVVAIAAAPSPSLGAVAEPKVPHPDKMTEDARTLERWVAPLRGAHIQVAGHVRVGRPDREIAQVASDVGANLIVVGTTGKQGVARLLLGSVAESLVRHAPCAVLAYRPRTVPAWELIEPPCLDCLTVQQVTSRASLWCEHHSRHHQRAHTYHEVPESFGMGSQTFRS